MVASSSYILCSTPRSGSTLLCGLLQQAGCGRPDSYFRRQSLADFARDWGMACHDTDSIAFSTEYLQAVLAHSKGAGRIFGLRIMAETLPELSDRLRKVFPGVASARERIETAFGSCVYVHLFREDKVAQAVSLWKAKTTGLWHLASDGSELERTAPNGEPIYDRQAIGALVREATCQDDAWRTWFIQHTVEPVRLSYESLSRDPQGSLRMVLAALGLDPAAAKTAVPPTARLANGESEQWIARYRAETAKL